MLYIKRLLRNIILFLLGVSLFALDYPTKRGCYTNCFTNSDPQIINWISRFDVVEIGGIGDTASPATIIYLKKKGVKTILCYDWMPAIYYYLNEENFDFVNWVYTNREFATINPDGPFPHTEEEGYSFARDYYLDFGEREVIERRVNFITDFVVANHYNGIFWDWGSGVFINEQAYSSIKQTFENKHPGENYLKSVGDFYSALESRCNELKIAIFSNQGYRNPANVLPYVNYDMAESYIVGYNYFGKYLDVEGYGKIEVPETQYFPVSIEGEESFYDTLEQLNNIKELIKRFAGKNFKQFIFMDYAAPDFLFNPETGKYTPSQPKNAIFLSFATAKLINASSYLEITFDKQLEFNDIYFVDLGKAYGDTYQLNNIEHYAIRFFENGFVIVFFGNQTEKEIVIDNNLIPPGIHIYDLFNKTWGTSNNHRLTIEIKTKKDKLTGKTIPAGRVFMYEKTDKIIIPPFISNQTLSKRY